MFDTRFASSTAPGVGSGPALAASLLHLILIVAAVTLTGRPSSALRSIPRDTLRLELAPTPARPPIDRSRSGLPPAPVPPPPPPDLPYMPTVGAAGLERHPIDLAALVGLRLASPRGRTDVAASPPDDRLSCPSRWMSYLRSGASCAPGIRAGITGEVKLEYVIDRLAWPSTGSARVIASTDPAFAMSSIEAVLGASFKPARRAGRPVARLVDSIRCQDR